MDTSSLSNFSSSNWGSGNSNASGQPSYVKYWTASGMSNIAAFSKLYGSAVNYQVGKAYADQYGVEADAVEVRAVQSANQLRNEFLTAQGNALYTSAARGIRSSSDVVSKSLERSAIAIGQDIQTNKANAAVQAGALRTQQRVQRIRAHTGHIQGVASAAESQVKSFDYFGKGWASFYSGGAAGGK